MNSNNIRDLARSPKYCFLLNDFVGIYRVLLTHFYPLHKPKVIMIGFYPRLNATDQVLVSNVSTYNKKTRSMEFESYKVTELNQILFN